jgi:hypothetical protein
MRCLRLENGNLIKNTWSKIESQWHVDFKHIFELNIVQVLSKKNVFKLDAEFEIFKSAARFSVYFDFICCLRHENGNLKKNALSKIESLYHADSRHIFGSKIGFLRKPFFKMTNFGFAAVWSPLPPPPPHARSPSTLWLYMKGVSTLCRSFRVPQYTKTEEIFWVRPKNAPKTTWKRDFLR